MSVVTLTKGLNNMFVRNTMKVDIEDNAFGGYYFSMPPGVSAIWTKAGEDFLERFKARSGAGGGDVAMNLETGQPTLPPLVGAERADWKLGVYAQVRRYPLDASRLQDRNPLIALAKERGINNDRLKEYEVNKEGISIETIVAEINKLPIPEEVRFPEQVEEQQDETT